MEARLSFNLFIETYIHFIALLHDRSNDIKEKIKNPEGNKTGILRIHKREVKGIKY